MNKDLNNNIIDQQNNQNLYNGYYQNLNINQSCEINNKPNMVPEFSNNNNNNNLKPNNKNSIKIIGIILIIVIALGVTFFIFKRDKKSISSEEGYSVNYDEVLSVYQLEGLYEFDVEILSIEKNYPIKVITSKIDSLAIKVKITNTGKQDLEIRLLRFGIKDNLNNNIGLLSNAFIREQPGILDFDTSLPKNESITGYLFFYDFDEAINKKINSSDINKLVVEVPTNVSYDNDNLEIAYESYYFNLK